MSLLLAAAAARGATYYSSGQPTVATPSTCGIPATCGGVEVGTTAQLADLSFAANVYAATTAPVRVQLPLSGTAPAGYRAGMLVSSIGTVASLDALSTATLRTYLDNTLQETQPVDLALLKAALLAGNGSPEQLEFTTQSPFNRVELELGSATASLGRGLKVQYAYGLQTNQARQVPGYVSRFANTTGQYDTGGCTAGIGHPERAADTDLTNYATFATIASVNCTEQLKVNLEGTAPAGYRAGFVVGGLDNLLNANLLGGIRLHTYRNGVEQEAATGTSLLDLSVLPSGQSTVSFLATKAFDAVSIERLGTVSALDNLQLYYGTGMANTPATQVRSNWADPTSHSKASSSATLCISCAVTNPDNAVDLNLTNYATLNVPVGVASWANLLMELNGGGQAGNRAGVVLAHQGGLLDASALSRVTLSTYDAAGKVLETHSGSQLLRLETLPDGRQSVSFNTTRDFASVSIQMGGLLGVSDATNVYYGFADDSTGETRIVVPTSPLPVQLVALAVQRLPGGAAQLSWTTASEANSLRFVVERSTDPQQGFATVGTVAAAGSSATTRQYSLRDAEAAALAGTLYYRLRQEDQDGSFTYSRAVTLAAAANALAATSLYPNPATRAEGATLSLTAPLPAGATVGLYSVQGQALSTSAVAEGQVNVHLATQGLATGLYYVVLRDASGHTLTTQRLQVLGE